MNYNNQHYHIEQLSKLLIDALAESCFECCMDDKIDNAGELTYYIDTRNEPVKMRLRRKGVDGELFDRDQIFVLESDYPIQFGFINTSAEIPSKSSFGAFTSADNLSFKYDLILFLHDEEFDVNLARLTRIFSEVADCNLFEVETNPVQVFLRHAHLSAKDLIGYPPGVRAYAFSYYISIFPNEYYDE